VGVESIVFRGVTFVPLGHKVDKENARAGGDTSVQSGGRNKCKEDLTTGKQRPLRDKESM